MGKLVREPLTDFSNLTGQKGYLDRHEQTAYHKTNAERCAEFQLRYGNPERDVSSQVDTALRRQVDRNRSILTTVVDVLKLAAIQNLPLRGHRDDGRIDPSGVFPRENDGNFRMLIRFRIQSGDEALQRHLQEAPNNAMYTSKAVQNELLEEMADLIKDNVSTAVRNAGPWVVMADDTTDRANREQMALVVRYVAEKENAMVVKEDPVALVDVVDTLRHSLGEGELRMSGENLSKVVLKTVSELHLDMDKLVAQCYDGAASMSSLRVGVAAHVLAKAPLANYFHCSSHAMNLAASMMNRVEVIRNALGVLESIVVFITDSAKREELLRYTQSTELSDGHRTKLIKLCQTRFVERHVAVERFWEHLPAVQTALDVMTQWEDRRTSSKATMLLKALADTGFLVGLAVAKELAGILRPLSLALQERGGDLTKAMELVTDVKTVLSDMRGDESSFSSLMAQVVSMAEKLDVELKKPRMPAISRHRSNTGRNLDTTAYYRVSVYNQAIDNIATDIDSRFSAHQKQAAGLQKLLPTNVTSAKWEDIQPVYQRYKSLLPDSCDSQAAAEFRVWAALCRRRELSSPTAISALNECPTDMFPIIHGLLKVLAVLPVSTAEPERVFSRVGRTLTALRATMREERMEALVLAQAYRDKLPDSSTIVDRFAQSGARKLKLKGCL